MKKLSEETEHKIVNPNPIEVITFLDRHHLAILFNPNLGGCGVGGGGRGIILLLPLIFF